MKIKIIQSLKTILLLLIFSCLTSSKPVYSRSLLMGTIQFPRSIQKIPSMRIYNGGKKINTDIHQGIPKITFEIKKNNDQEIFYLLITAQTESIQTKLKNIPYLDCAHNTFDYLYLEKNKEYTLYRFDLIENIKHEETDSLAQLSQQITLDKKLTTYHWNITQEQLPDNGQIPDYCTILIFFPELVEMCKGGDKLNLPTIILKSSLFEKMGSEKQFMHACNELIFSSLAIDTLHACSNIQTKQNKNRTLIMHTLT